MELAIGALGDGLAYADPLYAASLGEFGEPVELPRSQGWVLRRATQVVDKGGTRRIGADGGMNALMRPALYNAWHDVANLDRLDEAATELVDLVGPVCESSDVLAKRRLLPPTQEGDVLLVATAGAYGFAMANRYNLRALPLEATIDG